MVHMNFKATITAADELNDVTPISAATVDFIVLHDIENKRVTCLGSL